MKWSVENLFENQKIRPMPIFRECYRDCYRDWKNASEDNKKSIKTDNRKFHIIETEFKEKYRCNQIIERCSRCFDPSDELSETIPSYLMDYNQLLRMEEYRKNGFNDFDGEIRNRKIDYYIKLKKGVAENPYFRHLKRVANRRKFQMRNK